MIRYKYFRFYRISSIEKGMLVLLLAMTLVRATAFSERKAIIEMLVPVAVLLFRRPRLPPIVCAVAPFFAIVLLTVVFSAFEYVRSWVSHYQSIEGNFATFAVYRLFGYYITALDNGAGILHATGGGVGPVATMEWFWHFPVDFGQREMLARLGYSGEVYKGFLYGFASPEFNNPSGLYMPYLDFGKILGTAYWCVLGFVIGAVYRRFIDGWLIGLVLYPILYVGVIEMPRTFALGSPRVFPALVGCVLLLSWMKLSGTKGVRVA